MSQTDSKPDHPGTSPKETHTGAHIAPGQQGITNRPEEEGERQEKVVESSSNQ